VPHDGGYAHAATRPDVPGEDSHGSVRYALDNMEGPACRIA
jgi:hypothetical protein